MRFDDLIAYLKAEEGLKLKAYKDTEGVWTIGYGTSLRAMGLPDVTAAEMVITRFQAEEYLRAEAFKALTGVEAAFAWWGGLDPVRQAIVVAVAYQLGLNGLRGFKKFIAAMKARDFKTAAAEMMDSKWARQTPNRAARAALMLKDGRWLRQINGTPMPERMTQEEVAA